MSEREALKVLVFGDTHIPSRRDSIPEGFYKHIEDTKYEFALITGDLVREEDMKAALPPLPRYFVVRGNMDFSTSAHGFHEKIQIESFNILLIHGTQLRPRGNIKQLWDIADNVRAHIAIHGHTHQASIDLHKDKLLLNPGTLSGATGGWGGRTDASFIELDAEGEEILVTLHQTDWTKTKTSEIRYRLYEDEVRRV
ncbi:MAG: YfcE family phosphodiesterase [Candidatus Thorarchaeota archaeon]